MIDVKMYESIVHFHILYPLHRSTSGSQLKGEFTKCAVGMELPNGHELRSKLVECKTRLEELMDELLI